MIKLVEMIYRGFPQQSYDIAEDLKPFYKFRHDLHVVGGIVCYKDRIVIPTMLRQQVLEAIHAAHQGGSGMISRVEDSVFWPGITPDIIRTRGRCMTCARDAPSQPAGTPIAPPTPSFPFQYIVGDYFSLEGRNFLVIGDRFSGWLSIFEAGAGEFDAKSLVKRMREWCEIFNIPEEIATDGGPQMTSTEFKESLKAWDVRHRLSSAYYPHSNCRAELAVKAGKRLLRDNMGPGGSIDNDRFMRAIMQFRNTPMQDCRRSPAQMVYGRQLRDFLPALHNKLEPMKDWSVTQEHRERTLAKKREDDGQRWATRTKDLAELVVGTEVAVQNQPGKNPTKWDKTGVVLESRPHSQVLLMMDGSRRATLRNRKFVRPLHTDLKKPITANLQPFEENVMAPMPPTKQTPAVEDRSQGDQGDGDARPDPHPVTVEAPQQVVAEEVPEEPSDRGDRGGRADHDVQGACHQDAVQRSRRSPKPNPKYSPEVYDLDYVGSGRKRSRRSIRRVAN